MTTVASASAAAVGQVEPERKDGKGHLAGEPAIWFFVFGELLIFSAYFIIYLFYRSWEHDQFVQSQGLLDQKFGVVNTLVLIASSWFVAMGVQAVRQGNREVAAKLVALAAGFGVLFCGFKALEWSAKIGMGLTVETDTFFSFYYMLTGTHLYHVVGGIMFLVFVWREIKTSPQPRMMIVETGAIFWHLVDLLWIVIYALLYLMRWA